MFDHVSKPWRKQTVVIAQKYILMQPMSKANQKYITIALHTSAQFVYSILSAKWMTPVQVSDVCTEIIIIKLSFNTKLGEKKIYE